MLRIQQIVLLFVTCLVASQAFAATGITGVRMWDAPDHTRLVFDLSNPTGYSVFTLKKPNRVVIDLKETGLESEIPQVATEHPVIDAIRASVRRKNDFRVVLDLGTNITPEAFFLAPNDQYGHRLVVDLPYPENFSPTKAEKIEPVAPVIPKESLLRDVVVAIDAGHGGEDPGAYGRRYGTREKDVVLNIARKLASKIDATPGMRAVLIRDGDYYISLRKRIELARRHKADLFLSIHADAYKNSRVAGSSVYVLSARGASDEASRWLEARENASDLMGGVSLDDKDDVLASVLLDLSMSGTIDVSTRVADDLLNELGKVGKVRKKQVQYARFVVLKSPDIPSVLIETAFISNPKEEHRLRSEDFQSEMASGILKGVENFFRQNPLPNTSFAQADREHLIRRGETLSGIAGRYSVAVSQLMNHNQLSNSQIQPGQTLRIP
ncbi:MAG: N-acetylmuramoyl-L-alanine amidase [Gammaproteobacteria bacterium]|nr:N-acetylmuramoyl-L-alanine amidase [Gammaproteobacteria bacterium]